MNQRCSQSSRGELLKPYEPRCANNGRSGVPAVPSRRWIRRCFFGRLFVGRIEHFGFWRTKIIRIISASELSAVFENGFESGGHDRSRRPKTLRGSSVYAKMLVSYFFKGAILVKTPHQFADSICMRSRIQTDT